MSKRVSDGKILGSILGVDVKNRHPCETLVLTVLDSIFVLKDMRSLTFKFVILGDHM